MNLIPNYTRQFKKDLRRMEKRGKDKKKIREIMDKLIDCKLLEPKYKDHPLLGIFKNHRECHIEPDWLIIYRKAKDIITFERTGSHSDLFD